MTTQTLELIWVEGEERGKEFLCKIELSGKPLLEWVKTNVGLNKYVSKQTLADFYGACLYVLDERTKEACDEFLPFPEGEDEPYDDHYYGAINYARSVLKEVIEKHSQKHYTYYFVLVD